MMFSGKCAQRAFAGEAGGHRFQSYSPTDKKRRLHSSTVTVAVLPVPKRADIKLSKQDLQIEAYTGGGPGGQNRNRNATNIRITHIPSGVQACANTKSRAQNEKLAMAAIQARLAEQQAGAASARRNARRSSQIGTGMRSDKIRTIAEQRGRVENHINGKRMSIKDYFRGHIGKIR